MIVKAFCQELLFHTCKNGNFGCLNFVFTAEEMNVVSVSEDFGYMHGDKSLQLSAILLLVFVKVVVYNILEKPEDISWDKYTEWRSH